LLLDVTDAVVLRAVPTEKPIPTAEVEANVPEFLDIAPYTYSTIPDVS